MHLTKLLVGLPVPFTLSCKTLDHRAAAGLTSLTVILSWRGSTAYLIPPTSVLVSPPPITLPQRQTDDFQGWTGKYVLHWLYFWTNEMSFLILGVYKYILGLDHSPWIEKEKNDSCGPASTLSLSRAAKTKRCHLLVSCSQSTIKWCLMDLADEDTSIPTGRSWYTRSQVTVHDSIRWGSHDSGRSKSSARARKGSVWEQDHPAKIFNGLNIIRGSQWQTARRAHALDSC